MSSAVNPSGPLVLLAQTDDELGFGFIRGEHAQPIPPACESVGLPLSASDFRQSLCKKGCARLARDTNLAIRLRSS